MTDRDYKQRVGTRRRMGQRQRPQSVCTRCLVLQGYLIFFFLTSPDYHVEPAVLITGSPRKDEMERVWSEYCKNG